MLLAIVGNNGLQGLLGACLVLLVDLRVLYVAEVALGRRLAGSFGGINVLLRDGDDTIIITAAVQGAGDQRLCIGIRRRGAGL